MGRSAHHLLILQLLRDVARAGTGHLDPSLEDRARSDRERDVDQGVNGVDERSTERVQGYM